MAGGRDCWVGREKLTGFFPRDVLAGEGIVPHFRKQSLNCQFDANMSRDMN